LIYAKHRNPKSERKQSRDCRSKVERLQREKEIPRLKLDGVAKRERGRAMMVRDEEAMELQREEELR
jgi:hypothetical protein